jgi:hypothetical protein
VLEWLDASWEFQAKGKWGGGILTRNQGFRACEHSPEATAPGLGVLAPGTAGQALTHPHSQGFPVALHLAGVFIL